MRKENYRQISVMNMDVKLLYKKSYVMTLLFLSQECKVNLILEK